ncbi:MAG: hypothetical protein KA004_16875 [Verrucomicrobiales bacterium]|nr:hypothetical protein [Verrucomicrobiales bacterium]
MKDERAIDRKIATLENQLTTLRKQKLAIAKDRLRAAELEFNRLHQGLKSGGKGLPALRPAGNAKGGPRGPRLSDDDVVALLTREVKAAGAEGISARKASTRAGVFYMRAIPVMDAHFKKSGSGKWTRYRLK